MSRNLSGIYLTGYGNDIFDYYESNKKYHLSPESWKYGAVLVKMKRIKVGFSVKIKLFFRNHWYWKPYLNWKYGMRAFHWLFFMIWFENEYHDVTDKVVADHLKEYSPKP